MHNICYCMHAHTLTTSWYVHNMHMRAYTHIRTRMHTHTHIIHALPILTFATFTSFSAIMPSRATWSVSDTHRAQFVATAPCAATQPSRAQRKSHRWLPMTTANLLAQRYYYYYYYYYYYSYYYYTLLLFLFINYASHFRTIIVILAIHALDTNTQYATYNCYSQFDSSLLTLIFSLS